jgi:hypothetical protein
MHLAMGPIWHDFRRCRYNVLRIKNIWYVYDMVWDIGDIEKEKIGCEMETVLNGLDGWGSRDSYRNDKLEQFLRGLLTVLNGSEACQRVSVRAWMGNCSERFLIPQETVHTFSNHPLTGYADPEYLIGNACVILLFIYPP